MFLRVPEAWEHRTIQYLLLQEMVTADEIKELVADVNALVARVKDLEAKAVVDPALADPALEQSVKDAHAAAAGSVVAPAPAPVEAPATPPVDVPVTA